LLLAMIAPATVLTPSALASSMRMVAAARTAAAPTARLLGLWQRQLPGPLP